MLEYKLGIPTSYGVNSVKCNTKEYIFYTQKNHIQLINPDIPNSIIKYIGHNSQINSIDVLENRLVSCSNNIQIHDILQHDSSIRRFHTDDPFKINQVIFLNESIISSVDDNKMVKFYDLRQQGFKPVQSYNDSKDSVNTISYDHSGGFRVYCGSNDGVLYSYDLRMGVMYKDDFEHPITSISCNNTGEVLVNSIEQDLILFNFRQNERKFFNRDKYDREYKVGNGFLPMEHTRNLLFTGSEHGVLYGFRDWDNAVDELKLRGTVLSSLECVEGFVVVGDDYGLEVMQVHTITTNT